MGFTLFYNAYSGTYTLTWDIDFGKTKDMGVNHTYRYIKVPSKPTSAKWTQVTSGTSFSVKSGQSLWIGLQDNVTWRLDNIVMNPTNYNNVPGLTLKYKDWALCGGWWLATATQSHVITNVSAYILLIDDDITT